MPSRSPSTYPRSRWPVGSTTSSVGSWARIRPSRSTRSGVGSSPSSSRQHLALRPGTRAARRPAGPLGRGRSSAAPGTPSRSGCSASTRPSISGISSWPPGRARARLRTAARGRRAAARPVAGPRVGPSPRRRTRRRRRPATGRARSERGRRRGVVTFSGTGLGLAEPFLEAGRRRPPRRRPYQVSRRLRDHAGRRPRRRRPPGGPGDVAAQRRVGARRRPAGEHRIRQAVHRHDRVAVDEEHGEQPTLASPAERDLLATDGDRETTQHVIFDHPALPHGDASPRCHSATALWQSCGNRSGIDGAAVQGPTAPRS